MASITLSQPTLYEPLSQQLVFLLLPAGREFQLQISGEFRNYAGGRVRLIKRAPRFRGVTFPAAVDKAGLATLESWAGLLVLYRDGLGNKLWCSYLSANSVASPNASSFTVPLALSQLTFSEVV